jgi:alcohol dehydrogenase (NADP+)
VTIKAYGSHAANLPLGPMVIDRRPLGANDVEIAIQYCGVCHSDLHHARQEWGHTFWPIVPGHEIVGTVASVGTEVTRFKVGQTVGLGCMIDSCKHCSACAADEEQFCENGFLLTYNGADAREPGGHTLGGYAENIISHERFVLEIRHKPDQLAAVAPLLCAGITTYAPLKEWGAGPGKKVGIVGIGGLGHMGVKLSHAFGAKTVAFTTSESKRDAARDLGADEVIVTRNPEELAAHMGSFDIILNTVAASQDLNLFAQLLRPHGTLCVLGVPTTPHPAIDVANLIFRQRKITGSLIGGVAQTQEMLNFCADRGIVCDIELISIDEVEAAFDRLERGDVKYRFVIDNASLNQA